MTIYRWIVLLTVLMMGSSAKADRGGFHYTNYHVEAVVHKNNVWDIKETMDVHFDEPRHGIYRYIPLTFSLKHDVSHDKGVKQQKADGVVMQDWQTFNYVSEIDHLEVPGWGYSTEESDDEFCVIRIGDAYREVSGEQRYVVSYQYTYRDDRRPEFDYLFHTILGTDFNESIDHFSFHIEFEKPLPADIEERLEVYSGQYGKRSNGVKNLVIEASPNAITGEATDIAPNHGITLYAKLPADYYEDVLTVNYFWHYLFLALTIASICLLIVCMLSIKHKQVTKVIEFYPPEGINSAEVGTIIDESVDNEDIASMIPWLAGQGYLYIKEVEEKVLFGTKKDLQLTKMRDLPKDAPSYLKRMMSMLFRSGQTTISLNKIGEHPSDIETIKHALKNSFKGKKALTKTSWTIVLYLPLWLFSTMTFATNSVTQTFDPEEIFKAVFLWATPFALGVILRYIRSGGELLGRTWKSYLQFFARMIVMMGICFVYCEWMTEYGAPIPKWLFITLFFVCFILCELIHRFKVNTDYRIQMMGRLLGFREFIKTAEQPRLAALQASDPLYYYRVLPYAMVFKLTDKWAKLFKDIEVQKPDWYDTPRPLMGYALTSHLTSSLLSSTSSAIRTVSHDSSSSSGGGGGGGFSGGGGGGGGGGSW